MIPGGSFVCEYAGRLIPDHKAVGSPTLHLPCYSGVCVWEGWKRAREGRA